MSANAVVVLVNFLGPDLVRQRVNEAQASGHCSVIVDNSDDYEGPGFVIRPGANLGFGAACNLAVDSLTDPLSMVGSSVSEETAWICLVNPDTIVSPGLIGSLINRADAMNLDAIAPTLATDAGTIVRGYHQPQLAREVALATVSLYRYRQSNIAGEPSPGAVGVRQDSPNAARQMLLKHRVNGRRFASGAFLLIRRAAWDLVDGFDERFVLYGEDLDLWYRMQQRDLAIGFADDITVRHAQGKGSPTPGIDRSILRWVGVELFQSIHHQNWQQYRWVHLQALRALSRYTDAKSDSPVVRLIDRSWQNACDPIETAEILRLAFSSGLMKRGADHPQQEVPLA